MNGHHPRASIPQPITLVAGLGRCGSTMVMHMLAVGGMPTVGEAPDYEDEAAMSLLGSFRARAIAGHAVKALTLHRSCNLNPAMPYRGLWLDRCVEEQARSMGRFLASFGAGQPNRSMVRTLASSLRRDRPVALDRLKRVVTVPVLMLQFERILGNPLAEARRIARWADTALNADAMAAVVHRRSTRSLSIPIEPDLAGWRSS